MRAKEFCQTDKIHLALTELIKSYKAVKQVLTNKIRKQSKLTAPLPSDLTEIVVV